MDRGKEGKRSEGGGVVCSVPEMWIDGQIGDGNRGFWKCSADYHGRGEEQEPGDNSQRRHCPTHLHFSLPLLVWLSLWDLYFPRLSSPTNTHTHINTHSQSCSHCWTFSPRSSGKRGQSGIYVLQFIFVLEAPRGLSSMLARGNYTYIPPISPPITAH